MKKKLIIALFAALVCGANAAYALTAPAKTAAGCSGKCTQHSDCTGDCLCFPNIFGPYCGTGSMNES